MNRIVLAVPALALLAACAPHSSGYDYNSTPAYHATCQDRAGRILADWRCDQHSYGSSWAYEPYSSYQQHSRTPGYYSVGRTCTCGTTTQPKGANGKPVGIKYAERKNVTVFKDGKQIGSTTKTSQDAKKASTITGESKRDSARTPSYGSYQPKKSSSSNRSSFGSSRSSSSSRRR